MKKYAFILAAFLAAATISGCVPWWGHGGGPSQGPSGGGQGGPVGGGPGGAGPGGR